MLAVLERIVLYGFESTGKTTLANALASLYREPVADEYVRQFWDRRNGYITAADLSMIARGQIANEACAANRARTMLFCDTDLLTNRLWFDLLFPGHCPPWVKSLADQRSQGYALYLLCDVDMPFADDPQRSFPDPTSRQRHAARWRHALDERQLPVVTLRGNLDSRLACATQAIDRLMAGRAHAD